MANSADPDQKPTVLDLHRLHRQGSAGQGLILTQLRITNTCSVRIGVLFLICETPQGNVYNKETFETVMKHSKGFDGDLKQKHKKTTNRTNDDKHLMAFVRGFNSVNN